MKAGIFVPYLRSFAGSDVDQPDAGHWV